ncbi:MAG: hypothetical protein KC422_11820 [Trueperaceae bacterium]|nr:hypothetical protein [Trueperaceae bacterium]
MRLLKLLSVILLITALNLGFSKEMETGSEQFYVAQGLFLSLNIEPAECSLEDDYVNFACGWFASSVQLFQESVNAHISQELPGLTPTSDWFNNAGTVVRAYTSSTGSYLFAYNADGFIVVAFTPYQ